MNGLGFMIWQLANMPAPNDLVKLLVDGGVKWVTIKTLNGTQLFNAKGGNQKLLKAYWAAIKAAGIEVGAWQYVYGEQPGLEGDVALAFQEEFDPEHFMIDAEGEYKRYGATRAAKTYCSKLHNGRCNVMLCSYRWPTLHGGLIKPFPFSAFLNHEKVDGVAPQVYWAQSHDPGDQLMRSFEEYRALTSKPFIPIGSSFGAGFGTPSVWWEPTVADLRVFVATASLYSAYGFYSLDYILQRKRWDWWEAITQVQPPTPPPPEIDDHEKITRLYDYAVNVAGWDL